MYLGEKKHLLIHPVPEGEATFPLLRTWPGYLLILKDWGVSHLMILQTLGDREEITVSHRQATQRAWIHLKRSRPMKEEVNSIHGAYPTTHP